jgi:hypothetical protein
LLQESSCSVEMSGASTGEGWPVWAQPQQVKRLSFWDTRAPEKLLTAVVVGSSSPASVPNHQQVLDHAVFPIVKKLKGA